MSSAFYRECYHPTHSLTSLADALERLQAAGVDIDRLNPALTIGDVIRMANATDRLSETHHKLQTSKLPRKPRIVPPNPNSGPKPSIRALLPDPGVSKH